MTDPLCTDLKRLRVLVTRPYDQAQDLLTAIESSGGVPIHWPATRIERVDDPQSAREALRRLQAGDRIVFVSANAVRHGWPLVNAAADTAALQLFAVGPGTAQALLAAGAAEVAHPAARFDSDGLLELPGLSAASVLGRTVVIVRGVGGREHLNATLTARGATVLYAEVYRRSAGTVTLDDVLAGCRVDVVTALSADALVRLARSATNGCAWLLGCDLVVPSPRLVEEAHAAGFVGAITVAPDASDAGVLTALKRLAAQPPRTPTESAS